MRKGKIVIVLAFVVGLGYFSFGGEPSGPDKNGHGEPLTSSSSEITKKKQTGIILPANSDQPDYSLPDHKGPPCSCRHSETGIRTLCEHEELSCDKKAISECEERYEKHTCTNL